MAIIKIQPRTQLLRPFHVPDFRTRRECVTVSIVRKTNDIGLLELFMKLSKHLYYTIKTWNTLITMIATLQNLEQQAELEENDLDADLVDPAFAIKDLDEYEENLYGEHLT